MQKFQTQFTLSRDYLAECYDQSLPHGKNAKANYLFPAVLFVLGVALLGFTEQPKIAGIASISLGILELVHIRFRRAWWLTRQMWGRSADSEVKLFVDASGVKTQNPYTQSQFLWTDVEQVIETDLGLILRLKNGTQQYLSKSLFSESILCEILALNQRSIA